MNVLFVSPHPDDIEFACCGTLLKHKKYGDSIFILVVSDCSDLPRNKTLPDEVKKVMQIIQPDQEIRLDLPNRRLYDTANREILRNELENIRDLGIDLVYSPWMKDINQDHKTAAEETIRVFRYCSILQYEITHSCPAFEPDYYEEISETQMIKKLDIVTMFESQAEKSYASRKWIESVMLFRGLESGCKYAEAFKVWRIRKGLDG